MIFSDDEADPRRTASAEQGVPDVRQQRPARLQRHVQRRRQVRPHAHPDHGHGKRN